MNELRALVVEDEWPARSYLVELLQKTGGVEVIAAVASTREAEQALELSEHAVDLAFVDVHLGAGKHDQVGLVWLRRAAREAGAPLFVLATAHGEHALEAFDLGVSDYLLKPFTEPRVNECVARLLARRPPSETPAPPARIAARRGRAIVFLDFDQVWACEAAERLTFVHSAQGRFDLDLTLSAIAASFGRSLLRVHRNWLINPTRVLELERDAGGTSLFVGPAHAADGSGVRVPVAKDRAAAVRDVLLQGASGIRQV
ncbi:MAG TPA: LytTR family DNA-binding domain-containing protein [Polyangiaceae bacterium]|nr:LytTR family DNA-binding domain-containing protein [Polyangiaceae bacterium]